MATDPHDCGIYSITAPSGNQYIGSSKTIHKRWLSHKWELNNQSHKNDILQKSWNKYEGKLEFKKLLVCEEKDLLFYEQLLLDNFKPEYNICMIAGRPIGTKGRLGMPHTEETKKKMSESRMGIQYSAETKAKMSASGKLRVPTEETRRKISLAGMGKIHTKETRLKMTESAKKLWAERKAKKIA